LGPRLAPSLQEGVCTPVFCLLQGKRMDFDELEAKEEEAGPAIDLITKACLDPTWEEFLRSREEEQIQMEVEQDGASQKQGAYVANIDEDWEDFMVEKRNEWERWRCEERRKRLSQEWPEELRYVESPEMSSWEDFMKSNPDMFRGLYNAGRAQVVDADCRPHGAEEPEVEACVGVAQEEPDPEELEGGSAWHGARDSSTASLASLMEGAGSAAERADGTMPASVAHAAGGGLGKVSRSAGGVGLANGMVPVGVARRRRSGRGAFSASLARSEREGGGAPALERREKNRERQVTQPGPQAGEGADPTGLGPDDPTFAFVRRTIDTNRSQRRDQRHVEELQEKWRADVEEGVWVPRLSEVLERVEEDEQRDPDRQEEVLALENVLARIDQEDKEDRELEEVKQFLPDMHHERRETTLALSRGLRDVPLVMPAIRVLQETYQDWDMSTRDALEAFEVSLSSYQPSDEGYLSRKLREDVKRRMRREKAPALPAAPSNRRITSATFRGSCEKTSRGG